MRFNAFDTIVAPITGPPPAAVAWIRLSGPEAWAIAGRVFGPWQPEARRAAYGHYASGEDGLALPFLAEHSYTGEDAVELSMHGSRASLDSVLEACLAAGARKAEPGEFTMRAFLNGRIDLAQAEGVRESCEALTKVQLRIASRLREGALSSEVVRVRSLLMGLLAQVEASVDFSEEIGDFDRLGGEVVLVECLATLDALLATAHAGRVVREGYRIAIVGPPNAGKSSLLNALLRAERSIVTDIPGTTRDYVEELADFGGVPVVLIDTAGLRETLDPVEAIGVQRSRTQAAHADAVWYVYDSSVGWTEQDDSLSTTFERPVTVVANKSDLAMPSVGVAVSAVNREGIAELIELARRGAFLEPQLAPINRRHEAILLEVRSTLAELRETMVGDAPDDLLSVLLNQALMQIGEVTGETAAPDMIERIFSDFCIGK